MIRNPFGSLRAQLTLLAVAALVVAQAISLWLFVDERNLAIRAALGFEAAGRAASVVRLIEEAPAELHPAILRAADSPLVRFSLDAAPAVAHGQHDDGGWVEHRIRRLLDDPAPPPREIRVELHEIESRIVPMPHLSPRMAEMHRVMMNGALRAVEMRLSIALRDGRWLNVGTRFERPPLQWPILSVLTFGTTAAVVLIAALWYLVARLTGPLDRLARAAERLGRGEQVGPLPEDGPEELRNLTRAFNWMQARLTRFVADRTRIFAALGHDLRSPLTALRVRAELVDDEDTREALIETVEEMQQMAEATLEFAKGLSGGEASQEIELSTLLADLAEEAGGAAELVPGSAVLLHVRPIAIRRALRNVLSNALRYGDQARISWTRTGDEVLIEIRDRGPGIPEGELERVFDPFYRLETSRSLETGGHGLGLSIARSILRAHGGEIELHNDPAGGLVARLRLPVADRGKVDDTGMKTSKDKEKEGEP